MTTRKYYRQFSVLNYNFDFPCMYSRMDDVTTALKASVTPHNDEYAQPSITLNIIRSESSSSSSSTGRTGSTASGKSTKRQAMSYRQQVKKTRIDVCNSTEAADQIKHEKELFNECCLYSLQLNTSSNFKLRYHINGTG